MVNPIDPQTVSAFQNLVGEIFRANGVLLGAAEKMAADIDINPGRWQFIMTIREQPMTVSQAARRIGVTRQSAQATANKLRDMGLVAFADNPDHRRSPLVTLTGAGQKMRDVLYARQRELTAQFLQDSAISNDELEMLTAHLREMRGSTDQSG